MELKDKIRFLRKKHDLTLEQIGDYVGVSKSTVRKWEVGDIKNMKRDKISKLSEVLQTTPDFLMDWGENKEPAIGDGGLDDDFIYLYSLLTADQKEDIKVAVMRKIQGEKLD